MAAELTRAPTLIRAVLDDLGHDPLVPKSRKRKPKKTSSTTRRAPHRAESTFDRWDFKVPLPDAPDEVLAKIRPLPPEHTVEQGQLTSSPASAYLNSPRDNVSDEALDIISRWPFRIARSGEKAGAWICLALLAYEQSLTVEEAARATVELEDSRLLTWSSEHNVYVMTPEMPEDHKTHHGLAAIDAMFDRINSETASERAQRRWTQPTVVTTPAEDRT